MPGPQAHTMSAQPADNQSVSDIFINFLSTKGTMTYGHPRKYANVINPRFLQMQLEYGKAYGWIIVDYGTEQIARHIFETNELLQESD